MAWYSKQTLLRSLAEAGRAGRKAELQIAVRLGVSEHTAASSQRRVNEGAGASNACSDAALLGVRVTGGKVGGGGTDGVMGWDVLPHLQPSASSLWQVAWREQRTSPLPPLTPQGAGRKRRSSLRLSVLLRGRQGTDRLMRSGDR